MSPSPDPSHAVPPGGQAPPRGTPRFRETALASGLLDAPQLDACEIEVATSLGEAAREDGVRWDAELAGRLVAREALTRFQADQLLAGRRKLTLGQYRILDELGRGGMGQVFRAQHLLMGRDVAIKVLPRKKSTSEAESAFQREIRMLSRLDHDNLLRALDAGHDGKVFYLVTELVPGLDLRRQVLKYGPLDEPRAASVATQAAAGLGYAHGQGLVHRDVKPANLLATPDGHVKVLDLGLAGSVIDEESAHLGRVVGTMDFMAPEQIRSADSAGPAADIYALGCTLYFLVTGEVPFPGGTRQEKSQRQLNAQPRPVRELAPTVSPDFCRVIEVMMQKNPARRPGSAQTVIELLRPWTPPTPMAMPRMKPGDGAAGGQRTAGDDDNDAVEGPPASSMGGARATQSRSVGKQSTRGLLSALEETDRGSEPRRGTPGRPHRIPPNPAEGQGADAAGVAAGGGGKIRWGRLLVRSVLVGAVTGGIASAILRFAIRLLGGGDGEADDRGGLLTVVFFATFGFVLAVQLIVAAVMSPTDDDTT